MISPKHSQLPIQTQADLDIWKVSALSLLNWKQNFLQTRVYISTFQNNCYLLKCLDIRKQHKMSFSLTFASAFLTLKLWHWFKYSLQILEKAIVFLWLLLLSWVIDLTNMYLCQLLKCNWYEIYSLSGIQEEMDSLLHWWSLSNIPGGSHNFILGRNCHRSFPTPGEAGLGRFIGLSGSPTPNQCFLLLLNPLGQKPDN